MRFVDILRIFPDRLDDRDDYEELPEFTTDDILSLEQWPLLDRLDELGLCGSMDEDGRQLAAERLESRLSICYDYRC